MITKMGMPFEGLKKTGFSGSYKGMRFFVKASSDDKFAAFVYPEPFNFGNTPEDKKESKEFEYTHEGTDECIEWLNDMYKSYKDKWSEAYNNRNNAL